MSLAPSLLTQVPQEDVDVMGYDTLLVMAREAIDTRLDSSTTVSEATSGILVTLMHHHKPVVHLIQEFAGWHAPTDAGTVFNPQDPDPAVEALVWRFVNCVMTEVFVLPATLPVPQPEGCGPAARVADWFPRMKKKRYKKLFGAVLWPPNMADFIGPLSRNEIASRKLAAYLWPFVGGLSSREWTL